MGDRLRYTLAWVADDFVPTSFLGVLVAALGTHNIELAWARCGPVLYQGRFMIAELFMNQRSDHQTDTMLMVDPDCVWRPKDAENLLAHPEPVVSGVYVDSEGDLVTEGCGFLKIDRKVFETIGVHCFDPIVTPDGVTTGEDVAFRKRVADAGFDIVVDRSIRVGHVKQVMLWPDGTEQDQGNKAVQLVGRPVPMAPRKEVG